MPHCSSARQAQRSHEVHGTPAQELLKCLEAKAPVKNHDVADELAKAKAKMAEHGITMSPVKRKHDQDSEPSNSADKRAKPMLPHSEPEAQSSSAAT